VLVGGGAVGVEMAGELKHEFPDKEVWENIAFTLLPTCAFFHDLEFEVVLLFN